MNRKTCGFFNKKQEKQKKQENICTQKFLPIVYQLIFIKIPQIITFSPNDNDEKKMWCVRKRTYKILKNISTHNIISINY